MIDPRIASIISDVFGFSSRNLEAALKTSDPIDFTREENQVLLHTAVWFGQTEDVKELLARGADPDAKTASGNTAYDIALFQMDHKTGARLHFQEISKIIQAESLRRRAPKPRVKYQKPSRDTDDKEHKALKDLLHNKAKKSKFRINRNK